MIELMRLAEVKILLACLVSLLVTGVAGKILLPALRRAKAEQRIRENGPIWHNAKQGTPTMGGFMFIIGIAITCLTVGMDDIIKGELGHIYILVFSLAFCAIGLMDDLTKLRKKRNLGLTAGKKFILQLIAAAAFVILMDVAGFLTPNLFVPFVNATIRIPMPIYYVFAAFVIVGTVNSVNITDGVDGLATGVTIPVAICFTMLALIWGYTTSGIFAAALAGGLVTFLMFNFHPARVIMGDTGSLFLGGAICATAFAMDVPLVLIPLGIVFIVEALSDIIQVTYFKLTHGKRMFKMAPLHHHFEMCKWSERKIFVIFTAVSAVFAALTYFTVKR